MPYSTNANTDQETLTPFLKRINLFQNFNDDFFKLFFPYLNIEKFKNNSIIIKEGDTGEYVYFLLKGNVRIVKKTLSGEEYTVAVLKEEFGIFFGEVGLLTEDKRSASVLAENDCLLAKLNRKRFDEFITEHPSYGVKLLRGIAISICQKLQKSNHDILTLYQALVHEIGESYL